MTTNRSNRWCGALATAAALVSTALPGEGFATPITVTNVYHFLDNRSANSASLAPGLRQQFGADAVPNGDNGTIGTATQGLAFVNIPLNFQPTDTGPNSFNQSRPAATAPDGAWTLTFTNGTDVQTVATPTIAGANTMEFVSAMSISGSGNAPTFNWTLPGGGAPIEGTRIIIRDVTELVGTGGSAGLGIANSIYNQSFAAGTTSFTVNPSDPNFTQPLVDGRLYSLEVLLRDLRNSAGPNNAANTLSQSRSFFDFTLLPAGSPANVFLPSNNTGGGSGSVYEFSNIPVQAGQTIFIDPLVAIGYDYQIGAGDPNFASVTLPTGIGDNKFDLFLFDTGLGDYVDSNIDLLGGVAYSFGALGVDRFRILGIETSAGLDPNDVTAFITGLSFVANGEFNGTMTPITVEIPLPGSLWLLALGLGLVAFGRRNPN